MPSACPPWLALVHSGACWCGLTVSVACLVSFTRVGLTRLILISPGGFSVLASLQRITPDCTSTGPS